jgi:hypothetical protein
MNKDKVRNILGKIPLHLVIIGLCLVWLKYRCTWSSSDYVLFG